MLEFSLNSFSKNTNMTEVKISLFAQLLKVINRNSFERIVHKYQTDIKKGLNSWSHSVYMILIQ